MAKLSLTLRLLLSLTTISAAHTGGSGGGEGGGEGEKMELWCVAKNNAEDAALQSALDWACGAGGANCGPIQAGGPCHDASDIRRTASYAFNDYFLKHGMSKDSCNFDNTAALTSLNPSYSNCKFPSSSSVSNGSIITGTLTGEIGPTSSDLNSSCSITHRSSLALIFINLWVLLLLVFLRD